MTGAPGRLHRTGIVVTALAVAFAALAFTAATTPWPPSRAGGGAPAGLATGELGSGDDPGGRGDRGAGPPGVDGGAVVMGRCVTPLVQEQRSRTDNVALAARILDGAVVGPGEEFLFNANLGRRTEEAGYKPARVIVDGRSEAGLAGGICQVSSTLYNAALLSGMEILERHPHSRPVPYLPMGLDATVSYGSLDLRWRNPWSFPVTVRAQVIGAGSELAVWIEGAEEPEKVQLVSEVVEVVPPRPAGEPGYTGRPVAGAPLAGGEIVHAGASGYRVRVWAETRGAGGERCRRLVSEDFYEPVLAVAR